MCDNIMNNKKLNPYVILYIVFNCPVLAMKSPFKYTIVHISHLFLHHGSSLIMNYLLTFIEVKHVFYVIGFDLGPRYKTSLWFLVFHLLSLTNCV